MRILIFFLLLVTTTSCSTKKNDREVELFNNIKFNLLKGEKISEITPAIKDSFQAQFGHYPFQLPLFRFIENNNYRIFIALPYNVTIKKLVKYQLAEQDSSLMEIKSDSGTYYFKKYKDSSNFISEYVTVLDNNLVYLFSSTNSKNISDSLFNYFTLSQRISKNKE